MVNEREPAKAPPSKAPSQPSFKPPTQPEFGRTTNLHNRLEPHNIFNIPKKNQPRPEHHRSGVQPPTSQSNFRPQQPLRPRTDNGNAENTEIPYAIARPANPPVYPTYAKPPPVFPSVNTAAAPFHTQPPSVPGSSQPVIDLTRAQYQPPVPSSYNPLQQPSVPPPYSDRLSYYDPSNYINSDEAEKHIKALFEGAIEDEEDKPRTRGRRKKLEAEVEGLSDKIKDLNVKSEKPNEGEQDVPEDEEEQDVDDGTREGLKVKLLPHQVEGVAWMQGREQGGKKKNGVLPKGGILADDMGL